MANQGVEIPGKVDGRYDEHMPEAIGSFLDRYGHTAKYKYKKEPIANAVSGATTTVNGVYNDVKGTFLGGRSQHIILDPFEQTGTWCSTDSVNTAQGRSTTFLVTYDDGSWILDISKNAREA